MAAEVVLRAGMAGELPELDMTALCIAVGCAEILRPLLGFLAGAPARSPVLHAAAAAVALTLPMAYLTGVIFLYLHVAPAGAAAPVHPAAHGQLVVFVSALLLSVTFLFFVDT